MWFFVTLFLVIGAWLTVCAQDLWAQSADPFVSAVNEKQAEMARSAGVFGDQLIRDHQVINDQAKQINDLTKQLADLKAKAPPPAAAEPEKK